MPQRRTRPRWVPRGLYNLCPQPNPRAYWGQAARRLPGRTVGPCGWCGSYKNLQPEARCFEECSQLQTVRSLAFEERPLGAAVGNGLLTCGGRRSRDRETLGRFSTRSDDPFRTPQQTGSEPRPSETGEGIADPAKKGGNRESREVCSRLDCVNPVVDRFTGKNKKLPR